MKLLGLSDEDRLAFEETTGIKTEAARLIIEESVNQTEQLIATALREVQEVVGPHGSVSRLQAGGIRITPSSGISVFEDGTLKTSILPDGNLLVGSAITESATTTFCVFVNDQTYNNEAMGAGDLLIGDNSTGASNVKYDASEGQLQFRAGTTVHVYMDTDGTLKAGSGAVVLDSLGISMVIGDEDGNKIKWINSVGTTYFYIYTSDNNATFMKAKPRGGKNSTIELLADAVTAFTPEVRLRTQVNDVDVGSLKLNTNLVTDGVPVILNEAGADMDTRIEGDTDANLVFVDASTDRVGIGTATPGYKLDVNGSVNVAASSTYKVNGADVLSAAAPGRTQEEIEDFVGAMVSGNTETGIAVTYDDTGGKINFDAQTAGDARYAPIAKGVTNGDSHDHNGGDGAQISYLNLSNLPTAETNANFIFRCGTPGGNSAFVGTINGTPSGASVVYNVTSGQEGAMVPTSTSQLAKMRLYNTTRGTNALISNCNTGTNTITLTATVPAAWANGDTITIASQTTTGGTAMVDLEITSGPTNKTNLFVVLTLDSTTAGHIARLHPLETYAVSKAKTAQNPAANVYGNKFALLKITNNVFSLEWVGAITDVIVAEDGYLS